MNDKQFAMKQCVVLLSGAIALVGCGGGGGGGGGGTQSVQAKGVAVDLYLKGSKVVFEDCGKQETTTGDQGQFTYPAGCTSSALTVTGGTDIGTNLPFIGILKAPKSTTNSDQTAVVSPLTTLISAFGGDVTAVANKLGLAGKDLLTLDPLKDATVLKATVVVQQLVDQVQKTLLQVSESNDGNLSSAQAAQAAQAALVGLLSNSTTSVSLTNPVSIESVVKQAVVNSKDSLPASVQQNLDTIATNVAAVTTATIQTKVAAVDQALSNVTISAGTTPTAVLSQLQAGGKLEAITNASSSNAAANIVSVVASALTVPNAAAALKDLGAAVTQTGSNAAATVQAAFSSVNTALPADKQIPATAATELQTVNAAYSDYIQLNTIAFNGSTTSYKVNDVDAFFNAGTALTAQGGLTSVQLNMTKVGNPFQGNFSEAKVGLFYDVNSTNGITLVFDKVSLTFGTNGVLTGAVIPANTKVSFAVDGAATAQGEMSKATDEVLSVNNGILSLPINYVLDKVANASPAMKAQITQYTPKVGDKIAVALTLGATSNTTVRVGKIAGTVASAATSVSLNANGQSVDGHGAKTYINVQ